MDCSPPGSSVHGVFQAKILEWVAISFSITGVFFCCCFLCGLCFLKSVLLNLLQYCFYVLAFWPRGTWDLSSWSGDQTPVPCIGRWILFFFFFNYLFIYFRLCWVFVAVHGLSLVEARGGYSLVAGFRPLLLQSIGSSVPRLQ